MVSIATARANIVAQVVDGAPNSITPSKLRPLLTDLIDALDAETPFSKLDATTAPTANDDSADTSGNGAFTVGSFWIDIAASPRESYRCLDATATAAEWVKTTLSTDELGALALKGLADDLAWTGRHDFAREIGLGELSADPSAPSEGVGVLWISDGTGSGSDGDLMYRRTAGAVTTTYNLSSVSGISNLVEDTTPQLGGMLDVNGQAIGDGTLELLKFSETALAVNEITVTNAATGNAPGLSATGDDTNVNLSLAGKGAGLVVIDKPKLDVGSDAQGDIYFRDGSGTTTRLAPGTNGQLLKTQGSGANPTWADAGKVAQVVNAVTGAVVTGTTTVPFDDTIPQNTEGNEMLTCSITPTNASSTLLVTAVMQMSNTAGSSQVMALFKDSDADALAVAWHRNQTGDAPEAVTLQHVISAGLTSAQTFKIRCGSSAAGTQSINAVSGSRYYGGKSSSTITIIEILP